MGQFNSLQPTSKEMDLRYLSNLATEILPEMHRLAGSSYTRLLVASASVGDNQHAYNRYVDCSSSLAQFIFSTGSLEMVLRILWKYGMHYDGRTSQLKSTHEFSEERKLH